MRFGIKLLIGFVISVFVFAVYFATQVSAVYPPIRSYEFTLIKDELRGQLIETINSIPGSTFILTDSTGTKEQRYYYCDIIIKPGTAEYKYNIKYQKETSFWNSDVKSKIDLIGAFDNQLNTGGYKLADTDVKRLADIFEKDVKNKLREKSTSR